MERRHCLQRWKHFCFPCRFQVNSAAISSLKTKIPWSHYLIWLWQSHSSGSLLPSSMLKPVSVGCPPCYDFHTASMLKSISEPTGDWMALWRSLVVDIRYASRGNSTLFGFIWANANQTFERICRNFLVWT